MSQEVGKRTKRKRAARAHPAAQAEDEAPWGGPAPGTPSGRPSALLDTRIIYCGDCLDQLRKLPDACIDLI